MTAIPGPFHPIKMTLWLYIPPDLKAILLILLLLLQFSLKHFGLFLLHYYPLSWPVFVLFWLGSDYIMGRTKPTYRGSAETFSGFRLLLVRSRAYGLTATLSDLSPTFLAHGHLSWIFTDFAGSFPTFPTSPSTFLISFRLVLAQQRLYHGSDGADLSWLSGDFFWFDGFSTWLVSDLV